MSVLAIDLWDKRCGIALEVEGFAIPKEVVLRVNIISTIDSYISSYSIDTIVVWLPYDLYGKDLKQLEKTKMFIRELKNKYKNVKIEGIDERFTSFEAKDTVKKIWKKIEKRDDIAASLILESFLKFRK